MQSVHGRENFYKSVAHRSMFQEYICKVQSNTRKYAYESDSVVCEEHVQEIENGSRV